MKNIFKLSFGILAISSALILTSSCQDATKGDKAKTGDQQDAASAEGTVYKVDPGSTVTFTGYGVGKNHPGIFRISEGTVQVKDGQTAAGKFVIDINSMEMEQKDSWASEKLRPHLLSADFFKADTFKTAIFEITKVEPYTPAANDSSVVEGANHLVSGNLTIKDITKNVTFPAKIEVTDNGLTAKANFDIDRTEWGIIYNDDKKSAKDKFIEHDVNVVVDLKANK